MIEPKPKPRVRNKQQTVDAAFLDAAALGYLNRFDATEAELRRVLLRSVSRACSRLPADERPAADQIELWLRSLLERYVSSGLLNDIRFAKNLCQSLRARGLSQRAILARLRTKGVPLEVAEQAVRDSGEASFEAELNAAKTLVRRRRLGPFRPESQREEYAQKDLARLARGGFSFDIARRALAYDS